MTVDTLPNQLDAPQERFRLNPETISEALADDERTPERIVEAIADVEKRKALADELMQNVPQVSSQYQDIEALNRRLDLMAEVLPQKKSFFEKVKEKTGWALEKVKNIVTHPVVATILVGLLAWWAWGNIHGLLAEAHGLAAEEGAAMLGTATEGAAAAAPGVGETLLETPIEGMIPPAGEDMLIPPHSAPPPVPPPAA